MLDAARPDAAAGPRRAAPARREFRRRACVRRRAEGRGIDRRHRPFLCRRDDGRRRPAVALAGEVKATAADIDPALLLAGIARAGRRRGPRRVGDGPAGLRGRRGSHLALDEASFDGQPVGGALAGGSRRDIDAFRATLELDAVSLPLLAAFAAGATPERRSAAAGARPLRRRPAARPRARPRADGGNARSRRAHPGRLMPRSNSRSADGSSTSTSLQAEFAGGALKGALAATLRDGEAEMSLRGALTGARAADARLGARRPAGRLRRARRLVRCRRARAAASPASIATLAGSGSFAIDEGRLNALNPRRARPR